MGAKRRWYRGAATTFAALLVAGLFVGACGDDDDDDGNGGGNGTPQEPGSGIDRDPLNLEIQSADVPATGRPSVTFRLTDQTGAPVNLVTEFANANPPQARPYAVPGFTLAVLDPNGDYISYYQREVSAASYTFLPETLKPTPSSAAVTQAARHPAGSGTPTVYPLEGIEAVDAGNGVFRFTFPDPDVTGLPRNRTHTVAGWVVRTKPQDSDVAYDSFNFVPEGGGPAELEETITDAGCNKCHGVVQAHGTRRGTQFCMTCHSPQTTDPETRQSVDFKVMIHKIHRGADLPSVQQGIPYFIVGNRQSVHEWSEVTFPWHDGVSHCTACHQGQDQDAWKSKASLAACTSCHDNVKFDGTGIRNCEIGEPETGETWDNCNHPEIATLGDINAPQTCQICHHPSRAVELRVETYHHGDQPP